MYSVRRIAASLLTLLGSVTVCAVFVLALALSDGAPAATLILGLPAVVSLYIAWIVVVRPGEWSPSLFLAMPLLIGASLLTIFSVGAVLFAGTIALAAGMLLSPTALTEHSANQVQCNHNTGE